MKRNENVFFRFFAWIVVLSSVFCGLDAVLETHYLHKLCRDTPYVYFNWLSTRSGIVKFERFTGEPIDCDVSWRLNYRASPVLSIINYNLQPEDKFVITDSDNFRVELVGRGHFSDERKSFSSDGFLTVRFTSPNISDDVLRGGHTKFEFVYTLASQGPCSSNEFECKNGKCIDRRLLCDGHNHCGDRSDQQNCVPMTGKDFDHSEVTVVTGRSNSFLITVVVVGVVFAIVIFAMMGVFIHGIRKKKASQRSATAPSRTAPVPAVLNGQQHPVNPSFFGQIRNSFRSRKNPNVAKEDLETQEIPSIYPQTSLPMAVHQMTSTPSTHQQQQPKPSFASKIKRSFRSTRNPNEAENEPTKSEHQQTPSMYPEIPSAPDLSGIDNPDFEIEE